MTVELYIFSLSSEDSARKVNPEEKKKSRHSNSSILARAQFWDARINQGVLSDGDVEEDFPSMPDQVFTQYVSCFS